MTPLRHRIQAAHRGEIPPLRGPFLTLPSPAVVEICCGAFPDFICIDTEHGPIAPEQVENMLRAADLSRCAALVRVPGIDPVAIARALDGGAAGVLVPRVNGPEDARRAVEAARFAPEGARGAGPGRATGHGRRIMQDITRARDETVVALQIETVAALDQLEAILAVPGVDLLFVGPGDLGVGLAAAGRETPLAEAIDTILTACAAAGRPAGIFAMTSAGLAPWQGRIALAICGSDTTVLVAGFDSEFG